LDRIEDPIFILGCPRSGTSLLRRMIDSHSRIACPPESWFLRQLLPLLDDSRSMRGLDGMGFGRDEVLRRVRDFSWSFFEDYASAKEKPRWADKTPVYVDYLDLIDEVFEQRPRYVMIHRNGLDVARSMTRALPVWVDKMPNLVRFSEPTPVARAAAYWRDQVERIEVFRRRHQERCFLLRYEELCEAPDDVLRRVCVFLGEEYEPSMVEFHTFIHDDGIEDGSVRLSRGIEPAIGTYTEWDKETLKAAILEAQPMLELLGYSV